MVRASSALHDQTEPLEPHIAMSENIPSNDGDVGPERRR